MICPNKNSTSYKILEKYYTYQEIYEIFVANEYALPDESEVSSMIKNRSAITMSIDDIESKFNLRNQDGSRKRFLERNYRTTLNKVQQLNKSNPDFNFSIIKVMGEKGDTRTYNAIKAEPVVSLYPKAITEKSKFNINVLLDNQNEFIKELGVDQTIQLVNYTYNRVVSGLESGERFDDIMYSIKAGLVFNRDALREYLEDDDFTDIEKVKIQQAIDRYGYATDNWSKIETLVNHELNKTKGLEVESEEIDDDVKGDVYGKESYEIDPKTKVSAKLKILLSGIRKPDPKASQKAKARFIQDKVKSGMSEEAAKIAADNLSDYELYTSLPEDDRYLNTWFGQEDLIDFNSAYKNILPLLAGENENIETIINKLEKESREELWLIEVIEKLKGLDVQTANQFASQMTKHELDMRYVQINSKKVKVAGKTVEYYNTFVRRSNQNEISQLIHETWENNFIDSDMLRATEDDYTFNKQAVDTLKSKYDALMTNTGKVYRMVNGFVINSVEDYNKFKDVTTFKQQVDKAKADNIVPIVKVRGAIFMITDEGLVPKPSATLDVETITDIYESVGIKLSEKTAKSLSYKKPSEILQPIQYILENVYENIDSKYYEGNLQPLNQEGVKKLAKLESKNSPLRAFSPDNFRTQGKQIYAYTMKNFLTERAKELKSNPALISKLRGTAYHGNSVHLKYLDVNSELYNTEEGKKFRDSFGTIEDFDLQVLKDLQATVKWGDQRFTRVDEISQEIAVLGLFVNSNTKGDNRVARFVMPTFSDKTRSAIVPFITTKVTYENDTISDDIVDTMYNRIVMPEIKRIAHWVTLTELGLNHKQYKDGGRFFYNLPGLNELNVNGSNLLNIIKSRVENTSDDFIKIQQFAFEPEVEAAIKDYLKEYVNTSIQEKLDKWKSYEMVSETEVQFDLNYLKALLGTTSEALSKEELNKALKLLAADFKVNDMLAKAEMHYMFIGDPAMMYKGGKDSGTITKALDNNEPVSTWSAIYETYTNVGKRLALEIATGKKPSNNESEVYIQLMMEDPQLASATMGYLASVLDGKEFNQEAYANMSKDEKKAFIKGFENSGDFLSIDGADAQEFTTMGEWLHTMIQFGETSLTDAEVKELLEIENKPKPTLSEIQRLRNTIISVSKQPQKPVYSGQIFDDSLNAMNIVYVKSSAFPLSRHLTKDFQIDNLRIVMEELEKQQGKFVRASFESANKLGSVNKPLKVFDASGNVRPVDELLGEVIKDFNVPFGEQAPTQQEIDAMRLASAPYRELDRFNFRIQQENPVKEKGYIKRGTQETKLLWLNILDEPGMRALYDDYLGNYRQLYDEGRTDLFNELDLDLDKPLADQTINLNKLSKLLKKEAKDRNYPLQDLKGLDIVGNNFVMPLMFHASSNRYESLLNSVINNRILAVKMPGSSYILGTAEGFRVKEVGNYNIPEGVIFTSAWTGELTNAHFIDNATGKHITKKISEYNPENITFVPAKVLVPSKFVVDGKTLNVRELATEKDGRLYLDETKIDKSILQLFGFRIPTSGQMSMASIEIAGFLPEDVGDLIIAPRDFTKQMGSDFDVDKLMTYHYEIEQVEGKWVKKDTKKNRIIEIHHEVLSSKSDKIQEQILKPLSFDVAKDQAKLIQKQSGKQWSMLDDEYQKMKRIGGSSGKSGTGWFSLAVTFHATLQQLPNPVQVMDLVDEKLVPYNLTIAGLTSDGKLGRERTLGGGKRYVSEVHIQRQNYSVDNEKEQLMFPLNDNGFTFHFSTFLDELGFDLVNVNGTEISLTDFIRTQPVIQEYVALRNLDKSEAEAYDILLTKYGESEWKSIVGSPLFGEQLLNGTADQAAVLGLFMEASSFGDSMAKVMVAFNTDSAGLGKSIFDNLDKLDKIEELEEGKRFAGITQLRKYTINGLATTYGLDTTRVLNDIFPYDKFKPIFERLTDALGASLTVEDKQEIVREFRKFIFASHLIQQLEEGYDVETLRKELFFKTDSTEPLAAYVKKLKGEGRLNSSLFTLMTTEVNDNSLPSIIKWNNSIREDNENKYYFDWLSMFLNETSLPPYNGREMTYQSLAQVLVSYAYLEGGIQEATQFIKHVPIEYLKGVGFDKALRDINFRDDTTFGYNDAFLRQFIQHNPMKVKFKYTPEEIFNVIDGNSKDINKLTSFTLKEDFKPEFIRVYNNKTDIQNRKLRKKGAVLLFMQMDDGKYYKIPVLGIHGMNEYDFDKGGAIKSLVDSYNTNTIYNTTFNANQPAVTAPSEIFGEKVTIESLLTKVTNSNNPYYAKLAKFYLDNISNLDITLVFRDKKAGEEVPGRGWYDHFTKELGFDKDAIRKLLSKRNIADVEKLILHEFTHAFTVKYLDANIIPEALAPHILKLQRLFKIVERQYPDREAFRESFKRTKSATLAETEDIYGSYNILEFVSLIMTEPKFQEKMSKVPSGETTLWDRIANAFADLIRELLDFVGFNKDSITTEAMASIVNLVTYKPEGVQEEEFPDSYWESVAEEYDDTPTKPETQQEAADAFEDFVEANSKKDVTVAEIVPEPPQSGKRGVDTIEEVPVQEQAGFQGYVGGFAEGGKGTTLGDSKDSAMRERADSAIVALNPNKGESSSKTTLELLGSPNRNSKVIMLAINGSYGKPLSADIITAIKQGHAQGAEFIVGDMPSTDTRTGDDLFIKVLQDIGAKFTIYHTGNSPRINIPTQSQLETTGDEVIEISLLPIAVQGLPEIVVDLRKPSKCM